MADKNLNFNIKVNNKELDLTKTSFKDFNNIIKQAKKDLQSLPITDPRYKVLQTDIKNADAAWKEMNKTIAQSGDDMEETGGKVETFKKQIKDATDELFRLEKQFGKNSKEYTDQQQKIAGLRDAQEELVRTTQDLDDTLAAIPGPIGQIGQGMQQLEGISQNVGSAMIKLGINFKTTDGIIKASGVGALVLLLATLVAALISAAKSSKPLQDAFAVMGDAVGALFDALKPVTDFLINVFVGSIKIVSSALNGLASLFGGVSNGINKQTLDLERSVQLQEKLFNGLSNSISKNTKEIVDSYTEYKKALLEVSKALQEKTITDKQALDQQLLIELNHLTKIKLLRDQQSKEFNDKALEIQQLDDKTSQTRITNQRKYAIKGLENEREFTALSLANEQKSAEERVKIIQDNINTVTKTDIEGKAILLDALELSKKEEQSLVVYYQQKMVASYKLSQAEQTKQQAEFSREDIALINERALAVMELTSQLLKDEEARNLQQATFAIKTLKEQHRKELEEAQLAGVTLKGLKEKQAAEMAAAIENERKATIQYDSFIIQQEIDKQNTLLNYTTQGTQEYFDARKEIAHKELEQEILLADGNQQKIEAARSKHYKTMLDLDKEGIQSQIDLLSIEYTTLYDGTVAFYQKQRDIEVQNYELATKNAQGNYDKLEALRKQHERNMQMIDLSELQSTVDIMQRQADTKKMIFGGFFKAQKEAEETRYGVALKAAGDNYALIQTLEMEHQQKMKELKRQEFEAYLGFTSSVLGAIGSFYAQQEQLSNLRQQNELDDLQLKYREEQKALSQNAKSKEEFDKQTAKNDEKLAAEQDKIKEKYFYKNRDAQYAQAMISAFQSAISAYSSLAAIPVVGPALGAVAAAVALAFGIKQANAIKAQKYVSSSPIKGPDTEAAPQNMGQNYAQGGMIGGKRHAEGGTMIEAEKGEAIMTRGAVTMFAPMLSMMNQMGGGTSFNPSLMTTSYDKPNVLNPSQDQAPIIVKSYVVSSDMTSSQEKNARLKDLSTL
jgi:hypothetical protein